MGTKQLKKKKKEFTLLIWRGELSPLSWGWACNPNHPSPPSPLALPSDLSHMEQETACWIVTSCFSFPFLPETARFVCFIIRSGSTRQEDLRDSLERLARGSILLEVTMKRNVLRKKGRK